MHHLTTAIPIDPNDKSDDTKYKDNALIGSNLKELNLRFILQKNNLIRRHHKYKVSRPRRQTDLDKERLQSRIASFFYHQLIVSNSFFNLKHFYLASDEKVDDDMHGSKSMDKIVTIVENHNVNDVEMESFGCQIKNTDDENPFEKLCILVLNKFGSKLRSIHFETKESLSIDLEYYVTYYNDDENRNCFHSLGDWQFIKDKNLSSLISAYPCNLEEICISDYQHSVYNKFIQRLFDKNSKIPKMSLLCINDSDCREIVGLLARNRHGLIESIIENRLNRIIFNGVKLTGTDREHKAVRSKALYVEEINTFLSQLSRRCNNCSYKVKSFTMKAHFKPYVYVREWSPDEIRFDIDKCFECVSKLVKKIDKLFLIIEFETNCQTIKSSSGKYFNDFIMFGKNLTNKFNKQSQFYNKEFKSIIESKLEKELSTSIKSNSKLLLGTDIAIDQMDRSGNESRDNYNEKNYHLRMIFHNNDYDADGGYNGLSRMLYCCPNCDSDLR